MRSSGKRMRSDWRGACCCSLSQATTVVLPHIAPTTHTSFASRFALRQKTKSKRSRINFFSPDPTNAEKTFHGRKEINDEGWQGLDVLRIVIGWHFLSEQFLASGNDWWDKSRGHWLFPYLSASRKLDCSACKPPWAPLRLLTIK